MVYDVISFSTCHMYVISMVYDNSVKDANGFSFPDDGLCNYMQLHAHVTLHVMSCNVM